MLTRARLKKKVTDHNEQNRTQLFLKQSWEQKKLSLMPCLRHVGHCNVPASPLQSAPEHFCTTSAVAMARSYFVSRDSDNADLKETGSCNVTFGVWIERWECVSLMVGLEPCQIRLACPASFINVHVTVHSSATTSIVYNINT